MKKAVRKSMFLILAIVLCFGALTACGKKAEDKNYDTEKKIIDKPEKNKKEKDQKDSASDADKDKADKEKDAKADSEAKEDDGRTFAYADIDDLEFVFSSGAGAWQTMLRVEKDGYFHGEYNDSDMGDSGEYYENGTVYTCRFKGHFTEPTKVDAHTWSAKIKDIKYDEPGAETFADDVRYITSTPYGLMGRTFLFRDPETLVSDVSDDVLMWALCMGREGIEQKTLDMYVIENVDEQEAFSSYERMSVAEDASMNYEWTRESYEETCRRLNVSDMSQVDMNLTANLMYKNTDYLLNYLWDLVKYNADEAEYQKKLDEQRKWIKEKEADVEATGKMFEGGSMRPYVEDTEAARLTIDRCELLKDYLQKFQ